MKTIKLSSFKTASLDWGKFQVVECFLTKYTALSSNSSTAKKRKRKKRYYFRDSAGADVFSATKCVLLNIYIDIVFYNLLKE
jgi:hypothetical protein